MKYPTYTVTLSHPDTGADDETFEVYSDLMLDEAHSLLMWTGKTWADWLVGVDGKDPDCLRFLYWLARKRAGDPIPEGQKFSDINFWLHAMTTIMSDAGDFAVKDTDEPMVVTGPDPTEGAATESP